MAAGLEKGECMAAVDGWLEGFLHGPTALWAILLVSLLLGLRHASDPDHLAAVTTLIASEKDGGAARKASSMSFCWGLGHGTSLVLIGLPLVLLERYLPEPAQQAAETLIGVIIIFLAARLLVRWRRGHFHAHTHSHGGEPAHRHVHSHASGSSHEHAHHTHSHGGHTHGHAPADGSKVTWRGLMALGVSGGPVPCPAALVLLLGAISLDRLGFGMVLVVAFSAGLAIVLTGIGLLMIYPESSSNGTPPRRGCLASYRS